MTDDFRQGFLAGAAWAAHVAAEGAARVIGRPPSPDYERDGPRARGVTAEALRELADDLTALAPEACAQHGSAPLAATGPVLARNPAAFRQALSKGYTGDACPDCGNLTMVRNGTCLKCDTCGSTTGCS